VGPQKPLEELPRFNVGFGCVENYLLAVDICKLQNVGGGISDSASPVAIESLVDALSAYATRPV
jgi:hypothetical protein